MKGKFPLQRELDHLKAQIKLIQAERNKDPNELGALVGSVLNQATQMKILVELLYEFLKTPKEFLCTTNTRNAAVMSLLFPALSECGCAQSMKFNRFANSRRETIEDRIVEELCQRFEGKKRNDTINIVFLGGGDLLQEFIIIGKLIRAGFTRFNISLIDPLHYTHDSENKDTPLALNQTVRIFSGILKMFEEEKKLNFNVTSYPFVQQFMRARPDLSDLIVAIDFEHLFPNFFVDVLLLHPNLADTGKMYLSADNYDFVFSKDNSRIFTCGKEDATSELELTLFCNNSEHVKVANLSTVNYFTILLDTISTLKSNKKLERIDLTLIQLQATDDHQRPLGPNTLHPFATQENLQRFVQLFFPRTVNIALKLIPDQGDLQALLLSVSSDQNLVLLKDQRVKGSMKKFDAVMLDMHHHFLHANIVFGIKLMEKSSAQFQKVLFECHWIWFSQQRALSFISANETANTHVQQLYQSASLIGEPLQHGALEPPK